jgi:hypothetical protein
MLTYKQCRELLDDALSIMEDVVDGEDAQQMASEWVQTYTRLTTRRKGGKKPDPKLTIKYEKAKEFVLAGMPIGQACKKARITLDQWYRRKSVEMYGRSRVNKREY